MVSVSIYQVLLFFRKCEFKLSAFCPNLCVFFHQECEILHFQLFASNWIVEVFTRQQGLSVFLCEAGYPS